MSSRLGHVITEYTCGILETGIPGYSLYSVLTVVSQVAGKLVDFESAGGIPDDLSERAAWTNGRLMNTTLGSLAPGMASVTSHHIVDHLQETLSWFLIKHSS